MAGARAATWNVRGALSGSSGKLEAILHWGSQEKVGIIALQEVFATGLTVTGVVTGLVNAERSGGRSS